MGTVQVRSLDQPDETRSFPNGVVEMVTVAGTMIGRARFEPGWRWLNDVEPIAGTDGACSCMRATACQGRRSFGPRTGPRPGFGAGDGYVIQPGHDAWVVGDEPWVTVDFSQHMADYAKPS